MDRERHRRNPLLKKASELRYKYGLPFERYQEMMRSQEGRCALCGIPEKDAPRGVLHVDHCHVSGKIRALLCGRCNTALEAVERPGFVDAARAYLARFA